MQFLTLGCWRLNPGIKLGFSFFFFLEMTFSVSMPDTRCWTFRTLQTEAGVLIHSQASHVIPLKRCYMFFFCN